MKISQTDRLYELLKDGEWHSTLEIMDIVYGIKHSGVCRIGARIGDLKKRGFVFDPKPKRDPESKTVWWYKMVVPVKEPAPIIVKKQYPNGQLFNINTF